VLFEVQEGKYEDLDLPITTAAIFAGYVGAILGGTLLDKTRQHQGIASGAYLFVFIFHITLSVGIHVKSTTAIFVAYGALRYKSYHINLFLKKLNFKLTLLVKPNLIYVCQYLAKLIFNRLLVKLFFVFVAVSPSLHTWCRP